jgi:hypothetical protein
VEAGDSRRPRRGVRCRECGGWRPPVHGTSLQTAPCSERKLAAVRAVAASEAPTLAIVPRKDGRG